MIKAEMTTTKYGSSWKLLTQLLCLNGKTKDALGTGKIVGNQIIDRKHLI